MLPDNPQLGTFLAGLLVLPAIHLKAALNEHWAAFVQVLLRDFGGASPERHINKSGIFGFTPLLVGKSAVDCQSEVSDGLSRRRVTKFNIPRRSTH
jgi:hypothetical protein